MITDAKGTSAKDTSATDTSATDTSATSTSAGDNRVRVVLQICSGNPSPVALEAALQVARALSCDLDSLFVEDRQVFELAEFSFSREVSLSGRGQRNLSAGRLEREMRNTAVALRRRMEVLARRAEVRMHFDVVREEPVRAVAKQCRSCGPLSIVALGEAMRPGDAVALHRLFEAVPDTMGVLLTGPRARRSSGPVIIVAEDVEGLADMMRMAKRLSGGGGDRILLMIGADDDELAAMEGRLRLALGADLAKLRLVIAEVTRGEPRVIAESLRRLRGGFVIGRYGGALVPGEGDIKDLLSALECPLLLMR